MKITSEEQALKNMLEAVKTENVVLFSSGLAGYLEINGYTFNNKQAIIDEIRENLITEDKVKDISKINELELKNSLKDELATKEYVKIQIDGVKSQIEGINSQIKSLIFFMKVCIVLVIIFMTIFNPSVTNLFKQIASVL